MARYAIAIDVKNAPAVYSCFLACKDEFVGNDYLPHFRRAARPPAPAGCVLEEVEHGSGTKVKVDYLPILCQHCRDAPCISAGVRRCGLPPRGRHRDHRPGEGQGAKRKSWIAVPMAPSPGTKASGLAQKCTLCAHMLDHGEKTTRCVESCPTRALVFGDLDDPESPISQMLKEKAGKVESYRAGTGDQAGVKYFSLPKPFIAGEVLVGRQAGRMRARERKSRFSVARRTKDFSLRRRIFWATLSSRDWPGRRIHSPRRVSGLSRKRSDREDRCERQSGRTGARRQVTPVGKKRGSSIAGAE